MQLIKSTSKDYSITYVYIVILLILSLACGCRKETVNHNSEKSQISASHKGLIVPSNGAYLGAYMDFGAFEDDVTLEKIKEFEMLSERKQAIVAFSNIWSREIFPEKQLWIIKAYGAIPLIYWSPWGTPGSSSSPWGDQSPKEKFPVHYKLTDIIGGAYDVYIDEWIEKIKDYKDPVFVAFGIEMNGDWFPWSGFFYGAGNSVTRSDPIRYEGPDTFVKAYRYLVDKFRNKHVNNAIWVFHANNSSSPDESWNRISNYWPGSNYVDWIALSAYGKQSSGPGWTTVEETFDHSYKEVCSLDPNKPIMLAEWGVGEFPANGDKGLWISQALKKFSSEYSRLKAAVYWHERWQNHDLSYTNIRISSSSAALEAYKKGIANPFWLERPTYRDY